ncbi:hypothetical protein ABPG75_001762 [Micractinium tetrahymenae]
MANIVLAGRQASSGWVLWASPLLLLAAGFMAYQTQRGQATPAALAGCDLYTSNADSPAAQPGASASALPSWRASPHVAATGYQASLTDRELSKGVVSFGDKSRARRAMAKLLAGQPISIAFVSGSITEGKGASQLGKNDYVARALSWLNGTFPGKPHRLLNAGHSAVPSSYFSLCVSKEVPDDVDVVFVEVHDNGYMDRWHPADKGHQWLAELVIYWLQQMLLDVALFPLEAADEEEARRTLPPPMYGGNWEAGSPTCMIGQELKPLVSSHTPEWNWTNEGTEQIPKWGYTSTIVGSSLELTLNTCVANHLTSGDFITLGLAMLASYEHMGAYSAACVEGCTCETLIADGTSKDHNSQMNFVALLVTAADVCKIKLTVLKETQSGEHKVRLLGILLSEDKSGVLVWPTKKEIVLGVDATLYNS